MAVAKNLMRIVPNCGKGLNGITHANADFLHASHRGLTGFALRSQSLLLMCQASAKARGD
jgi:hypothetical protein